MDKKWHKRFRLNRYLRAAAFLFGLSMAAVFCSKSAQAAGTGGTIQVTQQQIDENGFKKAVDAAIDQAREKAESDGKIWTVKVVPNGTWSIGHGFKLYSNLTLDLTGVTIRRTEGDNIIHIGPSETATEGVTGYYYHDITIIGGTFDCANLNATGIKGAHVKNWTMEGCTVMNTVNAHLMEVAACDGLTLKNCTFKNQQSTKSANRSEAVQMDVLTGKHFNGYRVEALPMKNVTVTGCTFENVPRGVGSHTAILNAPFTGIRIKNNRFINNDSCPISFCYWKDVEISGNTITGSPRGIAIFSINSVGGTNRSYGTYLPSVIDAEGGVISGLSDAYQEPQDQKILISGNTMKLTTKSDPYAGYENIGILLYGVNVNSSAAKKTYSDKSGGCPQGAYYLNGVTITGNTITCASHGIRLTQARNCTISKNKIYRTSGAKNSGTIYGIHLTSGAKAVDITGNTVNKNFTKGIALTRGALGGSITGNTVKNTKQRGITLEGASADKINNNKIKTSKQYGIVLTNGSKVNEIKKNSCKKCKKKKIWITKGCKVGKKSGNK